MNIYLTENGVKYTTNRLEGIISNQKEIDSFYLEESLTQLECKDDNKEYVPLLLEHHYLSVMFVLDDLIYENDEHKSTSLLLTTEIKTKRDKND